jgi:hypothetical protein
MTPHTTPQEEDIMTTNNSVDAAFARMAEGLVECIEKMIEARIEYAEAHGFEATDEEIVASVTKSFARMIKQ